jgi:SAM-dependent methyltransferase
MHHCPLCETDAEEFQPYGNPPRPNARCPNCKSLERHRLVWLFLTRETNLFEPPRKRMLHVAPEERMQAKFAQHDQIDYVSADLDSPRAEFKMDLTDIPMPDAFFDVIYCSHVLEHIPDDRAAMSELYRVLKPGGWAILDVPQLRQLHTDEDLSLTPEERLKRYGQRDHVRKYGSEDYKAALEGAGFIVTPDKYAERVLGPENAAFYGVRLGQTIHFCRKAPAERQATA